MKSKIDPWKSNKILEKSTTKNIIRLIDDKTPPNFTILPRPASNCGEKTRKNDPTSIQSGYLLVFLKLELAITRTRFHLTTGWDTIYFLPKKKKKFCFHCLVVLYFIFIWTTSTDAIINLPTSAFLFPLCSFAAKYSHQIWSIFFGFKFYSTFFGLISE